MPKVAEFRTPERDGAVTGQGLVARRGRSDGRIGEVSVIAVPAESVANLGRKHERARLWRSLHGGVDLNLVDARAAVGDFDADARGLDRPSGLSQVKPMPQGRREKRRGGKRVAQCGDGGPPGGGLAGVTRAR